jgi:hypothetical protein
MTAKSSVGLWINLTLKADISEKTVRFKQGVQRMYHSHLPSLDEGTTLI